MTVPSVLRAELERIEASIAEIRKQELGVDSRLGEVQREKNQLVSARLALEEAAKLLRNRLCEQPTPTTVVHLPIQGPGRQVPVIPNSSGRKGMRSNSKIGICFGVIKQLIIERGGSAQRVQIIDRLREAKLLSDAQNSADMAANMLTKLKNRGFISNDYRGTWSLTNLGTVT